MTRDLVIIGCGGFGREVYSLALTLQKQGNGWHIAGFVDDDPTPTNLRLVERLGASVIGSVATLRAGGMAAVAAVGSPVTRRAIVDRLADADLDWPALVHPDSTVGQDVEISAGVVIAAGARLSTNVAVGSHVHIDQNVAVGHDAKLADFVRLNPAACISGNVSIGAGALIGANATVLPGLRVGPRAVVGAGAVVVRDVAAVSTVKGVPAR